jgi:N,N'-diacetyllegionaminate synthase
VIARLFDPERCFTVAEVAQAHDGSLGMAHAFIDAAARAGVDAIKFQTHIAAAESTPAEPWRIKFSLQDETRYDYWRRMEFSEAQWVGLAKHAADKQLAFISSPFSDRAAELLERVGLDAWKIASGEVSHASLLDRVCRSGRPVLVSTGMSTMAEIDDTVGRLRASDVRFAVLQCTSIYPCPPEKIGLNVMTELRRRHRSPVGLSDHSGTVYPALAAAWDGADVVEVHLTLSREMFGPDVPVSLTTDELAELVRGIRYMERMRASPVDKDAVAADLAPMRRLFTHSVVVTRDLAAGAVLSIELLAAKKPGTGIPSDRLPSLVGRRVRHAVAADQLLSESDLEDE